MPERHGSQRGVNDLEKLVGDNVRTFRKLKGLSQGELANRCKVKQSTISNLESGRRGFTPEILDKVSKALKVHPGVFFFPPID